MKSVSFVNNPRPPRLHFTLFPSSIFPNSGSRLPFWQTLYYGNTMLDFNDSKGPTRISWNTLREFSLIEIDVMFLSKLRQMIKVCSQSNYKIVPLLSQQRSLRCGEGSSFTFNNRLEKLRCHQTIFVNVSRYGISMTSKVDSLARKGRHSGRSSWYIHAN